MLTWKNHKLCQIYTYTSFFKEKKHSAEQTKPDLRSWQQVVSVFVILEPISMISFSGRMNRDLPFRSHSEFHKSFSAEEGWNESSHAAFTNPLILSLAPHLHCLPTSLGPPTFCFLVWSYCQWKKATMKTVKLSYRNVLKWTVNGELLSMTRLALTENSAENARTLARD